MRTIKLSYEGIGEVEVQLAVGKKMLELNKLSNKLVGEKATDQQQEDDLNVMCEIVSKCTKYTQEEVLDMFAQFELLELVKVINGDRESIKKATGS